MEKRKEVNVESELRREAEVKITEIKENKFYDL